MWFSKKKSPPVKPPAAAIPTSTAKAAPVRSEAETPSPSSNTYQQLERRLKKLEEELSHLTSKHPQIHIDNVHIHQPVLDNLTFRLDALDIKELSGSLNLGNNFGTKPNEKNGIGGEALKQAQRSKTDGSPSASGQKAGPEPQHKPAPEREPESGHRAGPGYESEPGPAPERTTTGYRYTPQSKSK